MDPPQNMSNWNIRVECGASDTEDNHAPAPSSTSHTLRYYYSFNNICRENEISVQDIGVVFKVMVNEKIAGGEFDRKSYNLLYNFI